MQAIEKNNIIAISKIHIKSPIRDISIFPYRLAIVVIIIIIISGE